MNGHQVAVVCPKGKGDSAYQVIDGVQIYKYRPYAPGGSKAPPGAGHKKAPASHL